MDSSDTPDLDRLLEQQLQREVATHPGSSAAPGMARYHAASLRGGMHMPFVPSFLAGLSAKGAAGLALAAIAVGGGAAATVASHSVDPMNWGQMVVGQVKTCKAEYGPSATPSASPSVSPAAKANVGQCVSAFAKTHGQMERKLHAHASPSGRPSGLPSGRPSSPGRPSGLPTPPAFAGKPSGLPTPRGKGRPSGTPGGH